MEEFVNVSVRIRPSFSEDITNRSMQVINNHPAVLLVLDKSQTYHFDNIFTDDVKQEDVYGDTVKRLVEKVKSGYNCTVFAYGQTGTGKTYTIGTDPDIRNEDDAGLISRTLEDFFDPVDEDNEIEIAISFIEIYNEKVFDLLGPNNKIPLHVKGFTVHGFKKVKVYSTFEALQHLKNGSRKRHMGETKQNLNSSRSHAIFSIYCCSRNSERETMAKLNLVDLAGSESIRKTGNQGSSLYEGININKGLLSLGQVMTALSTNSKHVPYRQSIITTILQDSLNKRNFVSLIACVSPHAEDLGETLQTLEFSNRVKKMRNKPEVNEFILQYKKDNPNLFLNNAKGMTPLKRSIDYSYETPFKKPRSVLPAIQEPALSTNSLSLEISPLFSSSMTSTISSNTPQNFSPVIRKYINAMEDSIVSKLQNVIKNTLRRPTRSSSQKEDKENSMARRLSWHKTDEDASTENTEIINQDDVSLVTSSPEEKLNLSRSTNLIARDCLEFFNLKNVETDGNERNLFPSYEDATANISHNEIEDDSVFKVPAPRNKVLTTLNNSVRRTSGRLQTNKSVPFGHLEDTVRRRSVRLQMKNSDVNSDTAERSPDITRRRSIRLKAKKSTNQKSTKTYSPCLNCTNKRAVALKKLKDSPTTVRTRHVLDILNNGSLRHLEKLHTVGTKTAEKIQFFRELKGKFRAVSDIAEMPYWTSKKYEKFLTENFLKK